MWALGPLYTKKPTLPSGSELNLNRRGRGESISQAEQCVGGDVVTALTGIQELCPLSAWMLEDTSCARAFGRAHDSFGEMSSSDFAGAGWEWWSRQQCSKSPSCTS